MNPTILSLGLGLFLLASAAAHAQAVTKDAHTLPANPTSSNVGAPIERGSEPGLRSIAEADRLGKIDARPTDTTVVGVLNGDERNNRDYLLFWPDWESDLVTPTDYNQ